MSDWQPDTYLAFADERTRPARDLLAHVHLAAARRVYDLGCGPGNSTAVLVARFPQARVTGIDNSPAMLEAARVDCPGADFAFGDGSTPLHVCAVVCRCRKAKIELCCDR